MISVYFCIPRGAASAGRCWTAKVKEFLTYLVKVASLDVEVRTQTPGHDMIQLSPSRRASFELVQPAVSISEMPNGPSNNGGSKTGQKLHLESETCLGLAPPSKSCTTRSRDLSLSSRVACSRRLRCAPRKEAIPTFKRRPHRMLSYARQKPSPHKASSAELRPSQTVML